MLALILATSGWFFGHIFSSSDAKIFWHQILNINMQLPFIQQDTMPFLIKNSMIYTSIFGILIAFFNYIIVYYYSIYNSLLYKIYVNRLL